MKAAGSFETMGYIYIINCLNSHNTYIISLGVHFNSVLSKENW